jgi:lysophospholipase L1-like esterase
VGGLLSGAVLAEVGLRLAGYDIPSHRHYAPGFYQADSALTWRLQPNYAGVYRGYEGDAPATTNAQGFRGPAWSPERLGAARRVLCLGDSTTFGYGVADAETFPRQLEGELGTGVAVFNGGVPGYGTLQELALAPELLAKVRPQVVVLTWLPNDVLEGRDGPEVEIIDGYLVANRKRYEKRRRRWAGEGIHGSALYRFVRAKVRARSHSFEGWEASLGEPDLEQTRREISQLAALARGSGARFLLVLLPRREELESASDCSHYERMRAWAAASKLPCVDLFQAWRGDPPDNDAHYLPRDGVHLKGAGYRRLAVAVASHEVFGKVGSPPDPGASPPGEPVRRTQ